MEKRPKDLHKEIEETKKEGIRAARDTEIEETTRNRRDEKEGVRGKRHRNRRDIKT